MNKAVIALACASISLSTGCDESAPASGQAGSGAATSAPAITASPELLARGQDAYIKGMCGLCHGPDGSGGTLGPSLRTGTWQHSDGSVAGMVATLQAGIPADKIANTLFETPMDPATILVAESELEALASYVLTLKNNN